MKKKLFFVLFVLFLFFPFKSKAQHDPDELGAWYMYVFTKSFVDSSWGFQGDIQHRNFNILGDLQQILLRGGVNYKPKNSKVKLNIFCLNTNLIIATIKIKIAVMNEYGSITSPQFTFISS